jgi:hypothetical protein
LKSGVSGLYLAAVKTLRGSVGAVAAKFLDIISPLLEDEPRFSQGVIP